MDDANVLRFIDHREVEDHLLILRDYDSQRAEQLRLCDQLARTQPSPNPLEDRPQHPALCFLKPCLSAEVRDIAIPLPVLQLPGINPPAPIR